MHGREVGPGIGSLFPSSSVSPANVIEKHELKAASRSREVKDPPLRSDGQQDPFDTAHASPFLEPDSE